jgi:uncharacterized protein YdeI (YjbR/CyaY-like superfamily)
MGQIRFTATLVPRGRAAAVVLDDEQLAAVGEGAKPEALSTALDGVPLAGAAFKALAYTHRKEYARWIEDARREGTRQRRIEQTV